MLDEITRRRQQTRAASKREALRRLRAYVGERVTMMDYPACRARRWDLGSGSTEAECKTMAARLKGAGMRWDPAGASALLQLTALQDSNAWEAYWNQQTAHTN